MMNQPKLSKRVSVVPKRICWPSLALGLLGLLLLFSCGEENPSCATREKRDSRVAASSAQNNEKQRGDSRSTPAEVKMPPFEKVLVVLVDALRADKLGCYGFDQPTSPAIDKMAKESVLFEQVHSASPWTAPSFGTLFTGVSPTVHGAGKMLGKNSDQGKSVHGVTVGGLRNDLPTLPQLLPKKMKKAAVINNSFVCKELGFAKGFDEFDFQIARLTRYRTADEVTDIAIRWLESNKDNPFFYFLHYFDPHIQYAPPKKYLPQFAPKKPPRIAYPFIDHASARDGSLNPSEAEKAYIRGLYHGEVRFVDDEFARLMAYMDENQLLDDTWIVLLSDHGEELFEHGSFDHGHRYEEEVVRVPWIIRAPGGKWKAGMRVKHSVSHVDVFATLLDLAGVTVPERAEGKSVLPFLNGKEASDRVAFMEYNLFRGQQCALFDGRYKIVYDIRREKSFMYDLDKDPGEIHKLFAVTPKHKNLTQQLEKKRARLKNALGNKSHNNAVLSNESRDALKSLGYIQ